MDDKKKSKLVDVLFLVALILINFCVATRKLQANDYFWHVKAGEYIVNNKTIPFSDIFSWYGVSHNLTWYAHEWLSEVFFYIVYYLWGDGGNLLVPPIVTSFIIAFLYIKNKDNFYKNIPASIVWFVIAIVLLANAVNPRPHIFGYITVMFTLYILDKYKKEDTKLIWFLPIISLAWVNLHGGSAPLIYIFIGIAIITSIFDFEVYKIKGNKLSLNKIKVLGLNFFLSILIQFINPNGFKMIIYPYVNMADKLMLSTISEWRCPDIKTATGLFIFVILGIVILTLFIIKTEIEFYDFILILAFTYLTLKSVRFTALFVIIATPIFLKYIPEIKLKQFKHLLVFPLTSITVITSLILPIFIYENIKNPIDTLTVPSNKAVQVIKNEKPQRLFNLYGWGGYLIYKGIPVFIDGRADMYSGNIYSDYIDISNVKSKAKEYINKYNFDMMVCQTESSLKTYLDEWTDFKVIYSDKSTTIFKRVSVKK